MLKSGVSGRRSGVSEIRGAASDFITASLPNFVLVMPAAFFIFHCKAGVHMTKTGLFCPKIVFLTEKHRFSAEN
jgi:hypothetical protein